jgi:hypothetical protein
MGTGAKKGTFLSLIFPRWFRRSEDPMQKLIEEVKFWKVLSRKFDELEYEFNVYGGLCRIVAPQPRLPS